MNVLAFFKNKKAKMRLSAPPAKQVPMIQKSVIELAIICAYYSLKCRKMIGLVVINPYQCRHPSRVLISSVGKKGVGLLVGTIILCNPIAIN